MALLPNFELGKYYLESNGVGNTFKATAKPVLIGCGSKINDMIFPLFCCWKKVPVC